MAEYIDTKHLGKCNTCTHCRNGRCNTYCDHFECYTPDLNLIPAADVVEVVRCKDCKFWGGKYSSDECSRITELANPDYWLKTLPDDFCSSGERKDGAE